MDSTYSERNSGSVYKNPHFYVFYIIFESSVILGQVCRGKVVYGTAWYLNNLPIYLIFIQEC